MKYCNSLKKLGVYQKPKKKKNANKQKKKKNFILAKLNCKRMSKCQSHFNSFQDISKLYSHLLIYCNDKPFAKEC